MSTKMKPTKAQAIRIAHGAVGEVIRDLRGGMLPCRVCGSEETLKDLDCMTPLLRARDMLRRLDKPGRLSRSGRGRGR